MTNPRGVAALTHPLGDALHLLRLTGALYCRADAREPWGVTLPALTGHVTMPVVLSGRALLEVGGDTIVMEAGSAALLARGAEHRMLSASGVPCPPLFDLPTEEVSATYERMRLGGDGDRTQVAYAALRIADPLTARLVAELPDVIHVDSWGADEGGAFDTVLRLLAREAASDLPGGETVMTRLADVLVIQVVRHWLRSDALHTSGWLAGLGDPHLGRALARIHAEPGAPWTLVELAREARLSRSAFAERFAALVGETPMRYLAGWRLDEARVALTRGDASVAAVSSHVGYASEAAFSRAFKRHHGVTPGDARRRARVG